MSIEKLDFDYVNQENRFFTTTLNDVTQNIHDAFILGVYCYLITLPPEWSVNKQHLMNHFNVGRDKIKSTLKWLKDHLLLEYKKDRRPDGTLWKTGITIKYGREFINKFVNKQQDNIHSTEKPYYGVFNHSTENPASGKSATYKIYNNKNKTKNINTAIVQKKPKAKAPPKKTSLPGHFMYCSEHEQIAAELGLDVRQQFGLFKDHHLSNNSQYFDWVASFRKWLRTAGQFKKAERPKQHGGQGTASPYKRPELRQQEVRCTVPEWGPGHPSYDSLMSYERPPRAKDEVVCRPVLPMKASSGTALDPVLPTGMRTIGNILQGNGSHVAKGTGATR